MSEENQFLIGALLRIPVEIIDQTIKNRLAQQQEFADLKPIHHTVFLHLPPEGCRMTELAERASMTRQAMSYLVDYLEKQAYLESVADAADGRAQIIRRTERGWQFHKLLKNIVWEIQQEWTEKIGEEDMQQLLSLLRKLVQEVFQIEYEGSISALGKKTEKPEA